MSPRAASRLESIGFEQVYDYIGGKADWGSAALPLEGAEGGETRAGAHLRADVPTCRLDDRVQAVCESLDESGWDTCFVVDDGRVVLGRIGRRDPRSEEHHGRGGDDSRAEHDQAQRPPRRDGRADAAPEAVESARDDIGRPAGRTAYPSRRGGSRSAASHKESVNFGMDAEGRKRRASDVFTSHKPQVSRIFDLVEAR